jgi:TRAP transporter TAXI family solute receptor
MTIRLLRLALIALGTVAVSTAALAQQSLTWTAGPLGGGWYQISSGLSELFREKAGITIKVVPGGGTQNPAVIEKGDADAGFGIPPLLSAATKGEDPYAGKAHTNLRALAGNMIINPAHFYVGADTPYAAMSLDDIFKGKKPVRLAISASGTADEWVFRQILDFYGTSYRDMEAAGAKFFRGSYPEQAGMFKDRNVDGIASIFLGLPAGAVTEASVGRSLKLMTVSQPLLQHLAKFGIGAGAIPPGTYPKAANPNDSVVSPIFGSTIVVSAKLSDTVAYTMTKALNDNADQVRALHASLKPYDPSKGWMALGVPLHPGAERYYREKGYLK